MSGLLVVTCGTTDLQFVIRAQSGETFRVASARRRQRSIHELLLGRQLPYTVDREAEALPFRDDFSLGQSGKKAVIVASDAAHEMAAQFQLETPLRLVPAKLSGLPEALKGRDAPDTVIVFNTYRDADPNEPIATGKILSTWLAGLFGLQASTDANQVRRGAAGWVNFLDKEMTADGPSGAPVNPSAVQRMDDALCVPGVAWKNVTLAITGGLPAYRDQIRALAKFRFPKAMITSFIQPQRQPGLVESLSDWEFPSDSYRLRGEVRKRISKGDIIGAAAIAKPAKSKSKPAWARPVIYAASYLNGTQPWSDRLPDYIADLVAPGVPRCLLPAMRAEAAICAGRLPEAVLWTFSFFDAALIDAIASQDYVASLDDLDQIVTINDTSLVPPRLMAVPPKGHACLSQAFRKANPNKMGPKPYKYSTGGTVNQIWSSNLGNIGLELARLNKRFSDKNGQNPRKIRNILTHSSLSVDQMRDLRDRFTQLGIWSSNPSQGGFFLPQLEVVAILTGLGMPSPVILHKSLIDGLSKAIENHRFD